MTPEENARVFGACYSKYGHGHDYVLETFIEGPIEPTSGLVVNVTDLDIVVKRVTQRFDHHHANFDLPEFKDTVPTTEHIAGLIFSEVQRELKAAYPALTLHHIRLFENSDLWVEAKSSAPVFESKPRFEVTREVIVRGIHHLENPSWTDDENRRFFGMCFGAHGHDYHIQVTCTGDLDEASGFAFSRTELDDVLAREIVAPFDGTDLNSLFVNTSCEALAGEFYRRLKPHLGKSLVRVAIQETRKNYFEFPPT